MRIQSKTGLCGISMTHPLAKLSHQIPSILTTVSDCLWSHLTHIVSLCNHLLQRPMVDSKLLEVQSGNVISLHEADHSS